MDSLRDSRKLRARMSIREHEASSGRAGARIPVRSTIARCFVAVEEESRMRKGRWSLTAIVFVLVSTSCDQSKPKPGLVAMARGKACADSVNRRPPLKDRPVVDSLTGDGSRMTRASLVVPGGLGGIFLNGDAFVVLLVDTTKRDSAIAALLRRPDMPQLNTDHVVIRQARWSYAELVEWYQYIIPRTAHEAISSSSIDLVQNRVTISVTNEDARAAVLKLVESLPIPCNLIAITLMDYPRPAIVPALSKREVQRHRAKDVHTWL